MRAEREGHDRFSEAACTKTRQSWPVLARRREQWLASARSLLDAAALEVLWQAGGALSADEAMAFALEE